MAELQKHQLTGTEPQIVSLVAALEGTGLIRVIASCEGHFGITDPEEMSDRTQAIVLFEPTESVTEDDLVQLFGSIYGDYIKAGTHWKAHIKIRKHYVPDLVSLGNVDDVVYELEIHPFDVSVSDQEKRRVTNLGIQTAATAVRNFKRPS